MDIAKLREMPHLSASSINDYIDCGLFYRFSRIDKIKPDFIIDSLLFGSVIHKVLAEFYQGKVIGRKMPLKEMLICFEKYWQNEAGGWDDIQYREGKDFDILLVEGKELLSTYYHKLPEDNFRVLAIEEPFSFTIPGLTIPIIGIIDLIEEDDAGTIIITDFKTSSRAFSIQETDNNFQLTIYQLATKSNGFRDREIILRFDCLIKTKVPKFEQYYTSRSEIDEKRAIFKIHQFWAGITKGIFIPNDNSWKCKGCLFKSHCDDYFVSY
jgi:putative RecB family exonuclease